MPIGKIYNNPNLSGANTAVSVAPQKTSISLKNASKTKKTNTIAALTLQSIDDGVTLNLIKYVSPKDAAMLRNACKNLNRKFGSDQYYRLAADIMGWKIPKTLEFSAFKLQFIQCNSEMTRINASARNVLPGPLVKTIDKDPAYFNAQINKYMNVAINRDSLMKDFKEQWATFISKKDTSALSLAELIEIGNEIIKQLIDLIVVLKLKNLIEDPSKYYEYLRRASNFDVPNTILFEMILDQMLARPASADSENEQLLKIICKGCIGGWIKTKYLDVILRKISLERISSIIGNEIDQLLRMDMRESGYRDQHSTKLLLQYKIMSPEYLLQKMEEFQRLDEAKIKGNLEYMRYVNCGGTGIYRELCDENSELEGYKAAYEKMTEMAHAARAALEAEAKAASNRSSASSSSTGTRAASTATTATSVTAAKGTTSK